MEHSWVDLVEVDATACKGLAAVLRQQEVPTDKEDPGIAVPEGCDAGNFYLLLVAICHQTQTLHGTVGGRLRRGWDYLHRKLVEQVTREPRLLDPRGWAKWSQDRLEQVYEDPESGRTLSEPGRRAELVRDLGATMTRRGWRYFSALYHLAEHRVASGSPHLLELLQEFEAYRDPVQKKSLFLLGLMRNSEGWTYEDEAEIGPPVDYHEVRGHLRLGTVKVRSPQLREKILGRHEVTETEDVAIRSAVYEAIVRVARQLDRPEVNPMVLHYLFWNLFRTVCLRHDPWCWTFPEDKDEEVLPNRYQHLVIFRSGGRRCPFAQVCASADASIRYVEHNFRTDWY